MLEVSYNAMEFSPPTNVGCNAKSLGLGCSYSKFMY